MAERFHVSSEERVNILELSLPVHVDHNEIDSLIETLSREMAGKTGEPWVVDLTQVEYTGSAALGLLVNVRQQIKTGGGSLVLCGLSKRLSETLHACSLDRLFRMRPSRKSAVKAV